MPLLAISRLCVLAIEHACRAWLFGSHGVVQNHRHRIRGSGHGVDYRSASASTSASASASASGANGRRLAIISASGQTEGSYGYRESQE